MTKNYSKPYYSYAKPRYTRYYNERHWNKRDNRYDYQVKQLPPHLQYYDRSDPSYLYQERTRKKNLRLAQAEQQKIQYGREQYESFKNRGFTGNWLVYRRNQQAAQAKLRASRLRRSKYHRPTSSYKRSNTGKIHYRFVKPKK